MGTSCLVLRGLVLKSSSYCWLYERPSKLGGAALPESRSGGGAGAEIVASAAAALRRGASACQRMRECAERWRWMRRARAPGGITRCSCAQARAC